MHLIGVVEVEVLAHVGRAALLLMCGPVLRPGFVEGVRVAGEALEGIAGRVVHLFIEQRSVVPGLRCFDDVRVPGEAVGIGGGAFVPRTAERDHTRSEVDEAVVGAAAAYEIRRCPHVPAQQGVVHFVEAFRVLENLLRRAACEEVHQGLVEGRAGRDCRRACGFDDAPEPVDVHGDALCHPGMTFHSPPPADRPAPVLTAPAPGVLHGGHRCCINGPISGHSCEVSRHFRQRFPGWPMWPERPPHRSIRFEKEWYAPREQDQVNPWPAAEEQLA